ncbi:DUF885 domain-containing protein [Formosa haliotis]|uniref:DUF885 domain-containing protein n=1 Tax=Formosa haliotis TaxID=1555194 RepID=UPI000826955F|nr:DUF885 domain-containing protein [Formosa haliotis]
MIKSTTTRDLVSILIVLFFCASCKDTPKESDIKTPDQSEAINTWFNDKYEELLQMSPIELTLQGRKDLYDQIDDFSIDAENKKLAWYTTTTKELQDTFDYDALNDEDKMSYDIWVYQYELLKEKKMYQKMTYVFDQMTAIHTFIPNFLINYHKVDSMSDMSAYISRVDATQRIVNQLLERAKEQADLGVLPPKFTFETVISQTEGLIDGQPLINDMNRKIDTLLGSQSITLKVADSLKAASKNVIKSSFTPAYQDLLAWLKSEIPNTEATPTGVSRHTNGADYYNYMLKVSTTTDLNAEDIHKKGLEEVARIRKEMLAIKDQVGFEGDLKAFFKFVDSDPQFYFPNTDEGRQAYIDETKKYLDTITNLLPNYFGILPKAKLIVKRVEAFREQDGAPQHYHAGTPDGSRPGVYYVHLSDMTSMDKTTMEGVAYHEGNPGHHMQISIMQELESVPKFRTQLWFTAYTEGWALYAEALAKEMGGYKNPYYDFGRLVNEIWRAIRLVVDTGLHSKGWTEADAFKYFKENSSVSEGAITAEVQRYMVIPGQATAYKIGMLKIQELRQKAESELGSKFDIKAFHDTVLGGGALPLDLLERRVDNWIASQKSSNL